MTDAAYFEAALPARRKVCGVWLKPLTLGHRILLHRAECAFVTGGQINYSDLIVGLAVCSRDYAGALRFLNPGWRENLWLRWRGLVTWFAVLRGYNLAGAAVAFREYVEESCKMPLFKYDQNEKAKPIRAPGDAVLKVALQESLGYSPEAALATPYSQAVFEHMISCARKGQLELLDEEWVDNYDAMQVCSQEQYERMIHAHARMTGSMN